MILLPLICLNHVESVLNRFTSICIVKGLGTQEAICGSEVVSFRLMYFHGTCIEFLRRLMKPITQRSLQAALFFSDAHGKEAQPATPTVQPLQPVHQEHVGTMTGAPQTPPVRRLVLVGGSTR